jgi:hypothetical protein
MEFHTCKTVGIVEYTYFAKAIDDRFFMRNHQLLSGYCGPGMQLFMELYPRSLMLVCEKILV